MIDPVLEIGPHVTALPIVHGSGDFAWEVRRIMASNDFDCLAVPLPPSFQEHVEQSILALPIPGAIVQDEYSRVDENWQPSDDEDDEICLLYTSPSPRDRQKSRMPSSA